MLVACVQTPSYAYNTGVCTVDMIATNPADASTPYTVSTGGSATLTECCDAGIAQSNEPTLIQACPTTITYVYTEPDVDGNGEDCSSTTDINDHNGNLLTSSTMSAQNKDDCCIYGISNNDQSALLACNRVTTYSWDSGQNTCTLTTDHTNPSD